MDIDTPLPTPANDDQVERPAARMIPIIGQLGGDGRIRLYDRVTAWTPDLRPIVDA